MLPSSLEVVFHGEKHLLRGRWKGGRTVEILNENSRYVPRAAEVVRTGTVCSVSTRISREQQLIFNYELVFL